MTTPSSLELQGLIVSTLKADANVMALVDGIYDQPPANPWNGARQAYISFGPSDMTTDDADCADGETHTVQLDVWSRTVGAVACKRICGAVKAALHDADLQLSENALVQMLLEFQQIARDPDGLTTHGAMQFTAMVELPE